MCAPQSKDLGSSATRILRHRGWFACVWNHRDLEDPLQAEVETLIRARIPDTLRQAARVGIGCQRLTRYR